MNLLRIPNGFSVFPYNLPGAQPFIPFDLLKSERLNQAAKEALRAENLSPEMRAKLERLVQVTDENARLKREAIRRQNAKN